MGTVVIQSLQKAQQNRCEKNFHLVEYGEYVLSGGREIYEDIDRLGKKRSDGERMKYKDRTRDK